jgi:ribonuclease P protein component
VLPPAVGEDHAGVAPGAGAADGFAFPREARITDGEEIRALLRQGKRRRTRHLDVFVAASPLVHPRWGMVVAKPRGKHQKSGRARAAAVQRNRLKRRLREIGRTEVLPALRNAGRPLDVLVRTRPDTFGASFEALRQELLEVREWLCSPAS